MGCGGWDGNPCPAYIDTYCPNGVVVNIAAAGTDYTFPGTWIDAISKGCTLSNPGGLVTLGVGGVYNVRGQITGDLNLSNYAYISILLNGVRYLGGQVFRAVANTVDTRTTHRTIRVSTNDTIQLAMRGPAGSAYTTNGATRLTITHIDN